MKRKTTKVTGLLLGLITILFSACVNQSPTIQIGTYDLYNDGGQTQMIVHPDSIFFYRDYEQIGSCGNPKEYNTAFYCPAEIWGNPETNAQFRHKYHFLELYYTMDGKEYQMDWVKSAL